MMIDGFIAADTPTITEAVKKSTCSKGENQLTNAISIQVRHTLLSTITITII